MPLPSPFAIFAPAMNKKILHLAIPSIVSNITVPLLGLVDVAIVGHLGSVSYIGAIAVGGLLFNIIYWIFGFLRMGTSGMTSQAYGRGDNAGVTRMLRRSAGTGLAIAAVLLLLQYPIREAAFLIISPPGDVAPLASRYFNICIWGAPAVLSLYAFTGWFIGMQNSRFPMYIAIAQNIVNIAASLFFVYALQMKVEGVALGTLVAQYAGTAMALMLWHRHYRGSMTAVRWTEVLQRSEVVKFFKVNTDIFLRTLCLVAVTTYFTSRGAAQGDVVLAVNTLLMQLFTIFSYIMDGFAYAGEALSGRYIGAGDSGSLHRMIRCLFRWGAGMSAAFTLLYAAGGENFLMLLTDDASVTGAAAEYFYWTLAIPVCGFAAFLWDGIFIGATATRFMLGSMAAASAVFFISCSLLSSLWGNHALWLSFLLYLSVRSVAEWVLWRRHGL